MIQRNRSLVRGTVYRIRNRKTKRCLSLSSQFKLNTDELAQNSDQLWVINEVKNQQYQILQVKEGSALTFCEKQKNYLVQLQKRKVTNDQFWRLILGEKSKEVSFWWIRPSCKSQICLFGSSLNSKVNVSSMDMTLNIGLWYFQPYLADGQVFSICSMFRSQEQELYLDLSEIASSEGVKIIQYLLTGSGSQRWIITLQKIEQILQQQRFCQQSLSLEQQLRERQAKIISKEYTIRNYSSGLNLAVQSLKSGFKIVQGNDCSQSQQRWKIIPVKKRLFLIQSIAYPHYYLGSNSNQGGSTVSLLQDNLKARWYIHGKLPL